MISIVIYVVFMVIDMGFVVIDVDFVVMAKLHVMDPM